MAGLAVVARRTGGKVLGQLVALLPQAMLFGVEVEIQPCLPFLAESSSSPIGIVGAAAIDLRASHLPSWALAVNGRKRRVPPVAMRPGKGPLFEQTAAVQPGQQDLVLMPQTRPTVPDSAKTRALAVPLPERVSIVLRAGFPRWHGTRAP